MKVVVASMSPIKVESTKRGFVTLFPKVEFIFEGVKANSGISDQPLSDEEVRAGAIGRVSHARQLSPDADYYVGLEGGVEEKYGDMYNFGWVVIESRDQKRGYGRTFAFALPPAIRNLIVHEGLEQGHATDRVFFKSDTKISTGTIGPLTNDTVTYVDWYVPAVVSALVPFYKEEFYPHSAA